MRGSRSREVYVLAVNLGRKTCSEQYARHAARLCALPARRNRLCTRKSCTPKDSPCLPPPPPLRPSSPPLAASSPGRPLHSYSSASLTFLLPAPEKLANLFTDATKERRAERECPPAATRRYAETGRARDRRRGGQRRGRKGSTRKRYI